MRNNKWYIKTYLNVLFTGTNQLINARQYIFFPFSVSVIAFLYCDHSFQGSKISFAFWEYRHERWRKTSNVDHTPPNQTYKHSQTQMRIGTHTHVSNHSHACLQQLLLWVIRTGAMTTRRPGMRHDGVFLTWITVWTYHHLNERKAGSRFSHKQEDLLAFPLRSCHVRRK